RVLFWSIPWHFVAPFTQKVGPTCLPTHAPGGVTGVAIAGDRAVWTTRYGTQTRVLASSIINCVEWVIARPVNGVQSVAGLSGHGGVLAFALRGRSSTVSLVPNHWRSVRLARAARPGVGISADKGRVAARHRGWRWGRFVDDRHPPRPSDRASRRRRREGDRASPEDARRSPPGPARRLRPPLAAAVVVVPRAFRRAHGRRPVRDRAHHRG